MLDEIRERQCGVVSRAQAQAFGLTAGTIRRAVEAGRWQRLWRGTFATFSGPVPREAWLWAAVLYSGDGGMLSHRTAAEVIGLIDDPTGAVHVTVPTARRVRPADGLVVHRSAYAVVGMHPTRTPPQTRVEETVVDLTQGAPTVEDALGWITRACGRRLTRPSRISAAIALRKKLRWRGELLAALGDAADGAQSVLEMRYRRDVERAHRLPGASRQHAGGDGCRRRYDDVRYVDFGVVVELDGRAYHPDELAWRDMRRDNASVTDGLAVLRYGWADVATRPCAVAAQVATLLRARGWRHVPRPCGQDCPLIAETSGTRWYPRFP